MPITAARLPRWRGFNLLEKFNVSRNLPFVERDFQWMADWGFDFVRLPMDYRCWIERGDVYALREEVLKQVDEAVALGKQYGVHVNINFHRAPGYCVAAGDPEPFNVWTDETARRACEFHWRHVAGRFRGVPSEQLSFNLFNEPPAVGVKGMTAQAHEEVIRRLVAAIREEDPGRLIIVDGINWGRQPLPELADLGIAQSTRAYDPHWLSHYAAPWMPGSDNWPRPTWPSTTPGYEGDAPMLHRHYQPWCKLLDSGIGVHCGEGGAFNTVPPDVVMAWMEDWLTIFKAAGWGWALWNLRGAFGIVDSRRSGTVYEKLDGNHELDRRMLELLRRY